MTRPKSLEELIHQLMDRERSYSDIEAAIHASSATLAKKWVDKHTSAVIHPIANRRRKTRPTPPLSNPGGPTSPSNLTRGAWASVEDEYVHTVPYHGQYYWTLINQPGLTDLKLAVKKDFATADGVYERAEAHDRLIDRLENNVPWQQAIRQLMNDLGAV